MPLPTLTDVLDMPVLRAARPSVKAAASHLDREVRWVHSTELEDIASLLRGGELILTTGIALPMDDAALAAYADSLSSVGAAGLMVELGRRWAGELPASLVDTCERAGLPLIALTQIVRFAAVTQAVGERIVDAQVAELRAAEHVHETFTRLSVAAANPKDILDAVQKMSGCPVVLEGDRHRPIDFNSGPLRAASMLADWEARSRQVKSDERTTYDSSNGWLVTRVETRGRAWGRLVLLSAEEPEHHVIVLIERAAAALALHQLHSRDQDNRVRRTHHELVLGLMMPALPVEIATRCEVAGFPTSRRQFVALSARPVDEPNHSGSTTASLADVVNWAVRIAADQSLKALICTIEDSVRVLLSIPLSSPADRRLDEFTDKLSSAGRMRIGVGRIVDSLEAIERTQREAQHVLDSIRSDNSRAHRLEDVHVRGLLALLGDDDRLSMFADRELSELRAYDSKSASGLLDAVKALVTSAGKSEAAGRMHLSRPAFYSRIAKAEEILGASLDDPETRLSLHLAILSEELREARRQ